MKLQLKSPWPLATLILFPLMMSCGPGHKPAECKLSTRGTDAGYVLNADIKKGTPSWSDAENGLVSLPLTFKVTIPCLRGGTRARVSTSLGTIGDKKQGQDLLLSLSPVGGASDGLLEGYVNLILPVGRKARVNMEVDLVYIFRDWTINYSDLPKVDGGVIQDKGPADSTPPTKG